MGVGVLGEKDKHVLIRDQSHQARSTKFFPGTKLFDVET